MAWLRWIVSQASCCWRPYCAFSAGVPADGGGVKKHLRAAQGGEPGGLGIPLIPADADADGGMPRVPGEEAEIAGREVEFLVKERVIRDVHLPVAAQQFPAGIENGGGIVIDARRAPLEERGDDNRAGLAGDLRQRLGGRPGNFLRQREVFVILDLAEVLGAEQLRQADDIRSLARGLPHHLAGAPEILLRLRAAAHLHDAEHGFFRFHGVPLRKESCR